MSTSNIIREAIKDYFKHHKVGKFEDLMRYLMRASILNKKLQEISWDLGEITKKILESLNENKLIIWDVESERIELLNEELIQDFEDIDELKRIEYNFFSTIEGVLKMPDSKKFKLDKFEQYLLDSSFLSLGELKPIAKSLLELVYKWDYEDFSIKLTILSTYFRIDSISTYLAFKPVFKNYISTISEYNRDRIRSLEKLPSESGMFFFLMEFFKILRVYNKNIITEITNYQNYSLSQGYNI